MLDLKTVRENPESIREMLRKRNVDLDLDEIIRADAERRSCITQLQELKQRRNALSQEVGKMKRQGKEPEELMAQARALAEIRFSRKVAVLGGVGISSIYSEYSSNATQKTEPLGVLGISLF